MRISLLAFICLSTAAISLAQAPSWQWAQTAVMSSGNGAEGTGVAVTGSGDVYATGDFSNSTMTIGSTALTNTAAGYTDLFLSRFNSAGSPVWAVSNGTANYDWGEKVATDANGNVYAVGEFEYSNMTFGPTTLVNNGIYDIFLVKYNNTGNVVWAVSAGGTDSDNGIGITTDAAGNVYITGYFNSPSLTFGSYTLTGPGLFIVKYDANGNVIWARQPTGQGVGRAVATDAAGNVFITGRYINGAMTFGSTTLTNAGNSDLFIAKYDPAGNVLWARSAGGAYFDDGYDVACDSRGNVYVSGNVQSAATFGPSVSLPSSSPFLVKYNASGTALWVVDNGRYVAIDPSDGVYSSWVFNGSLTLGSYSLTSSGSTDIFVAKYDTSGNVVWAQRAGGTGTDQVYDIALDSTGNCFLTGSFSSPSITFGSAVLGFTGSNTNFFVAKLASGPVGTRDADHLRNGLTLYPNPAEGVVRVSGLEGDGSLELRNLLGQAVLRKDISARNRQSLALDVSSLPPGWYLLTAKTDRGVFSSRLVIQ